MVKRWDTKWTVLAVGSLGTAVVGALRQGMPGLAPAVRDAFSLSLGEVGLVFSVLTAGFTVGLLPWGVLADRIGERPVLAGGLALTAAALAGAALAPSFAWLLVALFLVGLAAASANGSSGRSVMGWFARAERGFALGIRQTAIPVGGALAALSLPLLAAAFGLGWAFAATAAFSLVAALVAVRWLRDPPPSTAPAGFSAPPPTRDPRVWRLGVGTGLFVSAQAALLGFSVLFLHDELGLSVALGAAVLATMQVGAAATRIAIGRVSDRRERRVAPLRDVGALGAALVAAVAVLSAAPAWVVVPVLVAAGIAMMTWNGLAATAAAEISGRAQAGTAMGLQTAILSVVGLGAAPGFGVLADAAGYGVAFAAAALAPAIGWLVLAPLEDDEEHRAADRAARLAAT